jgi:hypothetical protein
MRPLSRIYLPHLYGLVVAAYTAVLLPKQPEETAWTRFADRLAKWLGWADLTSAAALQWRATHERTIVPEPHRRETGQPEVPSLESIADLNPWYKEHVRITDPIIVQRAKWVARVEKEAKAEKKGIYRVLAKGEKPANPLYQLERQARDAFGAIASTSEQVQLLNPAIGDKFPLFGYYTRQDSRVRCVHRPMNGFLALKTWAHWPICVPPCGFNCRCFTRAWSTFECINKGWFDKNRRPLFEVKWPNSLAQRNFEEKKFPEWREPRFWAATSQIQRKIA